MSELTNEAYHALDSISHSKLELFRRSRRSYFLTHVQKTLVKEQTPSMLLGSLVHAIVLEPSTFHETYAVAPECDRRTKEGKATWAEFVETSNGKTVVKAEQMDEANAIAESLLSNEAFQKLFVGNIEKPVFWECPITGLQCRSKNDICNRLKNYIVDIKTCPDASPEGFANSAANYGYARQAAWYRWGYRVANGWQEAPAFIFVAVSTQEPYEVGIYELDESDVMRGAMQNENDLAALAECMRTGNWKSKHEVGIVQLKLPKRVEYEDQYQCY